VSSENAISLVFHFNCIGSMKRDKSTHNNLICQFVLIFPVICSMAFAGCSDVPGTAGTHATIGFQSAVTGEHHLVWVRAPHLNYFEARGLVPPGSYSHKENQKPATIAINKAGQGVGKQK
jgi:hypothetical protein